jgi:hypothetical protein
MFPVDGVEAGEKARAPPTNPKESKITRAIIVKWIFFI